MPSYRITLQLGQLISGISPEQVQPAIRDVCAEVANVESSDIRIERGVPVVVTRFTALTDAEAVEIGLHSRDRTATFCAIERAAVTKRVKNRWLPL